MEKLGIDQHPTLIDQDNTGVIAWSQGGHANQISRHKRMDVKHNYAMELIMANQMNLQKVDMADIIAAFLTKVLSLKN